MAEVTETERYRQGVTHSPLDVLVVGAGVSGLTTAICLAEAGLNVAIQTDRLPRETTSSVAGAIWGPHLVEQSDRANRWSRETLAVLTDLAGDPATGIQLTGGLEAHRAPSALPGWATVLGEVRPCRGADLPDGFASGWRYTAPVVSMPVYLDYLLSRFRSAGGQLRTAPVSSLAETARGTPAGVIVNCTGAAARDLVPDPALTPVRGQIVVVANPGISEFFIGNGDETAEIYYVFPHANRVVLGGTEERGSWSLEPEPATAERILRDCAVIDPRLRTADIIEHRVGLRPARPAVRLGAGAADENGSLDGKLLLHNYGHGGAGITLSWGCAREIAGLIEARNNHAPR